MLVQPYPAWDIQFIIYLQHHLFPFLEFLRWISIFLSPPMFFALAMVLYFLDHRKGVLLFLYLALATFLALGLKDILHSPRPYWTSPFVIGYISPTDYGMPSGHALFAMSLFLVAFLYKKTWGFSLAFIAVFLVCLSRMALGAHYASQVLVGLALGLLCILGAFSLERIFFENWLSMRGVFLSLMLFLLVLLVILASAYMQWGMYFEPLLEWKVLAAKTAVHPLHGVSFQIITISFFFCASLLLSLFLEHFAIGIRGVEWQALTAPKIFWLILIFGVYTLGAFVILGLTYLLSPFFAFFLLGIGVPFFFCYQWPLEVSVLGILKQDPPSWNSKAQKISLSCYARFS